MFPISCDMFIVLLGRGVCWTLEEIFSSPRLDHGITRGGGNKKLMVFFCALKHATLGVILYHFWLIDWWQSLHSAWPLGMWPSGYATLCLIWSGLLLLWVWAVPLQFFCSSSSHNLPKSCPCPCRQIPLLFCRVVVLGEYSPHSIERCRGKVAAVCSIGGRTLQKWLKRTKQYLKWLMNGATPPSPAYQLLKRLFEERVMKWGTDIFYLTFCPLTLSRSLSDNAGSTSVLEPFRSALLHAW